MRKLVVFCLLSVMFFSTHSYAFASTTGAKEQVPESGGAIKASKADIAEAEKENNMHKYDHMHEDLDKTNSTRATWYSISYSYYGQQKSMSCGPASARMMLKYITGRNYSEATIRSKMTGYTDTKGVTLNNLIKYVNKEQNKYKYSKYYGASQSYIFDGFIYAIKNKKAVPVAGVKEGTSYGFPYNIAGHYIVVYSVKSDKASLKLKDPWAGYKGHTKNPDNRTYTISAKNFMKGYSGTLIGVGF